MFIIGQAGHKGHAGHKGRHYRGYINYEAVTVTATRVAFAVTLTRADEPLVETLMLQSPPAPANGTTCSSTRCDAPGASVIAVLYGSQTLGVQNESSQCGGNPVAAKCTVRVSADGFRTVT
jgi:hypothetical protein